MLDKALEALKTYDWGDDKKVLAPIDEAIVKSHGDESARKDLEKRLTSKIGTRVQIRHNSKRGQLVIDYHGNEDLQRLLELFGLD